ncbi:glycoside hydrolase family 99-like domain-containing protein [Flavisolibacter sp. BT320]|nr:glycoside hydrolase family 99-like domain-containing protein [Flavisolibacter longurius]
MSKIRPIAIYLPQFHPIPENDEWWGKGFTEWKNVVNAKPLFKGHNQPHLPSDLGFYDLRLIETMQAQAEIAKEYGLTGFCYYHYWFNGKRLLNTPLDNMLQHNKPDFPYMLCWANENWTRRWDGRENEVLIKQEYSNEDHYKHATFLCQSFFKDERYIKVGNKPVFVIYKASLIPDLRNALEIWNKTVSSFGFNGLYLLCMDNFIGNPAEDYGFEGAIHFHPDFRYFNRVKPSFAARFLKKTGLKESVLFRHHVEDYKSYYKAIENQRKLISKKVFPGITPMWDNTARVQRNGIIFKNSSPLLYFEAITKALNKFEPFSSDENFFFINAWNEWAEGNHLEPCQKYGHDYLKMTKKAIDLRNNI